MIDLSSNRCVLDGELVERDELRFTPAGVARLAMKIRHISTQQEADVERQLQCVVPLLALGDAAVQANLFSLGQYIQVEGFLAQRSLRIAQLVLHVNKIKLK